MKSILSATVISTLAFPQVISAQNAKNDQKPNILIILLDDAGYNDFGFMGSKDILTPNIDSLAKESMCFSNAYVSASVSGPSRAGLITGRYQQRGGYECNPEISTLGLPFSEKTIAELLKAESNYKTYALGKWHLGSDKSQHPNKRGFDEFYGFLGGMRSYFYRSETTDKNPVTLLQYNDKPVIFDGYLTDVIGNKASEFIKEHSFGDSPFFMYLSYNAVHTPMEALPEDLDRFKDHPRQKLAAMTWALDRSIGEVLSSLEQVGQMDNTFIFFLSDNGGATNNQSINYPLSGHKGVKYEGGIKVPFFFKYANNYKGYYDGKISSLDIAMTSLKAARVLEGKLENRLDGLDIVPMLEKHKKQKERPLFWRKDGVAAARYKNFKYMRIETVGEKLFDLGSDPIESIDLSKSRPDILKMMREYLMKWEKGTIPASWTEGEYWVKYTINKHLDIINR